jgi:hypothetical protein
VSLRAFHVFFIIASAALAVGFGFWALPISFGLGSASFVFGAFLAGYLFWFATKLRPAKKT